jgi:hypothetical protein
MAKNQSFRSRSILPRLTIFGSSCDFVGCSFTESEETVGTDGKAGVETGDGEDDDDDDDEDGAPTGGGVEAGGGEAEGCSTEDERNPAQAATAIAGRTKRPLK